MQGYQPRASAPSFIDFFMHMPIGGSDVKQHTFVDYAEEEGDADQHMPGEAVLY